MQVSIYILYHDWHSHLFFCSKFYFPAIILLVISSTAIHEVPPNGLQRWGHEVECLRRVFLTPVLNVCLLVMLHLLLIRSGDVESNPGPFGKLVMNMVKTAVANYYNYIAASVYIPCMHTFLWYLLLRF